MALELVLQILLEGNNWSSHKAPILHHRGLGHPRNVQEFFLKNINCWLSAKNFTPLDSLRCEVCNPDQSYGTNFGWDLPRCDCLLIISNFSWSCIGQRVLSCQWVNKRVSCCNLAFPENEAQNPQWWFDILIRRYLIITQFKWNVGYC